MSTYIVSIYFIKDSLFLSKYLLYIYMTIDIAFWLCYDGSNTGG